MSHMFTLVASEQSPAPLTPKHFEKALEVCNRYNIGAVTEEGNWLEDGKAAQIELSGDLPLEAMRELRQVFKEDKIDCFCIDKNFKAGLIISDAEGTVFKQEMMDELAKLKSQETYEEVRGITQEAMNGGWEFKESFGKRVPKLKGLDEETVKYSESLIEIVPGAPEFIRTLKRDGAKSALVSGGFTRFIDIVKEMCGFDFSHGNTLDIKNGKVTGKVIDPVLDKDAKLKYLREYAEQFNVPLKDIIALGDGDNDRGMFSAAGLSIGVEPKPVVEENTKNCLMHGDFTSLLFALGYTRDMFVKPEPDEKNSVAAEFSPSC